MTLFDRVTKFVTKKILHTSTAHHTLQDSTSPTQHNTEWESLRKGLFSPTWLLLLTLGSVLFAEIILNLLINLFEFHSDLYISIIDAAITTIIAFPIIYFLLFRRIHSQYLHLKKLESSLEMSEAAFREIVQDQSELICRMDQNQNIVFVNQAFCQYFPCASGMIAGSKFTALFQEDAEKVQDQITHLDSEHPLERRDYQRLFPDGTSNWLSIAIRAFYDDAGSITHYQAVGRDITEHKKMLAELQEARLTLEEKVRLRTAEIDQINQELRSEVINRRQTEAALQASESHFRLVIGQIPAVLWTTDWGLKLTTLLGSGLSEFATPFQQLLGVDLRTMVSRVPGLDAIIQPHKDALKGTSSTNDFEMGGRFYHCTIEPFHNFEGQTVGCLGIALDVTARKESENLIRLQSAALEAAADGIMITDCQGKILWCNPALEAMTGYSASEMVNKTPALFKSGVASNAEYAKLWSTILSGKVWRGELSNRRRDGSIYIEEQSITPVLNQNRQVVNFISIKNDITQRKEDEQKIYRRNQELQALNKFSTAISSKLEFSQAFVTLKKLLEQELSIPAGTVYLFKPDEKQFTLGTSWGFRQPPPQPTSISPGRSFSDWVGLKQNIVSTAVNGKLDFDESIEGRSENYIRLSIPLLSQGELQGVMELILSGVEIPSNERLNFYESLGNQIGIAIHNAALFRTEKEARFIAEVLSNASRSLTQSLEEDQIFTALFDSFQQIIPQAVRIMLIKPENSTLQLLAVRNEGKDIPPYPNDQVKLADGELIQEIIDTQQPLLIENAAQHPAWKEKPEGYQIGSWLGFPILVVENLIGVCKIETNASQRISPQSISLVEALIGQTAVAIQHARLYSEVRNAKTKLQALSRKMVEVQEVERRFISRELHDETSQALISLVFALEIIKREAGDPAAVAARVEELNHLIGDILNNLNRLAIDLRPASLDHLGLMPAIRQYVAGIRDKYGMEIQLQLPEMAERLPSDMETALYRIIQEGFANIIRHAQASQVEIRLELLPDAIRVHINDDGIGFNVDKVLESGHLGLFGMRERAEMIGGTLEIQSSPGFGTRLTLEVPYDFSSFNS